MTELETTLVACPLCSSKEFEEGFEVLDRPSGQKFRIVVCSCQFAFVANPPDPSDLAGFYTTPRGEAMRGGGISPIFRLARRLAMRYEVRELVRNLARTSMASSRSLRLVDIGAGDGSLSRVACREFESVLALDMPENPSFEIPEGVAYRSLGPTDSVLTAFEDFRPDVAVLRHVLEHVPDSRRLIADLRDCDVRALQVTVPNLLARSKSRFGMHWAYWDPPRHLSTFSARSLTSLLSSFGYASIDVKFVNLSSWTTSTASKIIERQGSGMTATYVDNLMNPLSVLSGVETALRKIGRDRTAIRVTAVSTEMID